MKKSIENIKAYMIARNLEFQDLSGNGVILLHAEFNFTDKQLRGIIIECYKNDYAAEFNNNKLYIHKGL